MKKLIFSILFFVISFTFFGQVTFNRVEDYFGTNGRSSNFAKSALKFGSGYIVSLAIYDTLSVSHFGIVKLDSYGNELDKFIYINSKGRIATYPNQTLISTSDSNIMICTNLVDTSWDGYLIKFDTNLDTLWTKVYDLPANLAGCATGTNTHNYFTAIKEAPDKGFIITGNFYKQCVNNASNLRSFLLKVDSLGNVEWWKVYQNVSHLYDIELTNDGGYVFLNKYGYSKFTKTDSLGNIQWNSPASIYIGFGEAADITPCGNGEFVVALPYEYVSQKYGMNVYKVNINTQQVLWDTTYRLYHTVQCISLNQTMGVEVDNNGDIIVWATAHVVESKGKRGAILKLNSQGDSLWAKYIVTDSITLLWDDLQINDLIITDDGGFMGVGYQWFGNSGQVMAWLFKTDANGVIGWDTSTPLSGQKVKVYPNPARDFTNIEFGNKLNKEAKIEVYNSLGQMVLQDKINKGEQTYRLELKGLSSGIYFFEVFDDKVVLG
ncbi:MAG: hypothetical protein DRI84_08535, partial [Bacteroidetes bacterium]